MKLHNYFKTAVLGMALFMMGNAQAQVPNYIPTDGLVGYWPFSGNANDISGKGNNGTVNGATLTTDRHGNANSAYLYNGTSSFINVPNSTSLQFNGGLTISTWLNTNAIPTATANSAAYLLSKGADGGTPNSWTSFIDSGGANLCIFNTSGNLNSCAGPGNPITINNWINVVYTYDGTNSKTYINGKLSNTTASNYTIFSNTYDLKFGRRHTTGLPYFFNGKLDDIGIWSRALSQQEITSLYTETPYYSDTCNAVSGSLVNGLVAYYPFCGNAQDQSGKGNNGTVNGATLTTDRFGNANAAYSFNGNSNNILVANSSTLNLDSNLTIAFWAKLNSSAYGIPLHLRNNANSHETSIRSNIVNSTNLFDLNNGISGSSNTINSINKTDLLWHHFVAVFDVTSNKTYLYIDNVLQGVSQSQITILGSSTISIGSVSYNTSGSIVNNQYFNGIVDDIGIWNRALTESEIKQVYQQNQCFTNTTVTDMLVINVGQLSYSNPVTYANAITIAPNPASTQITINFNTVSDLSGGTIKIINTLGQEVATTPITASGTNTAMTLSNWGGSGLYFVQIVNPKGQIVDIKKIMLQ